jgi:MoxR-like ATPase
MTAARQNTRHLHYFDRLDQFLTQASTVILDKEHEILLTLCCLLADGHLLIEDIPGVGKTTLVKMLARSLGLRSSRIQFTNDLLPADILGSSIFDHERKTFIFHPGPVFAELVLADELNRATPKTQSACLQVMEEHRITVDGITHQLPDPFFLIATQNPRQQIGTFALPESQLDRFLMRVELGYPSREAEKRLLLGKDRKDVLEEIGPLFTTKDVLEMQKLVREMHVSENIIDYIQNLVDRSRNLNQISQGLSPRGALALVHAAQSWAFLQKRDLVLPEDVQAVCVSVMSHRLNPAEDFSGESGKRMAQEILKTVRVL